MTTRSTSNSSSPWLRFVALMAGILAVGVISLTASRAAFSDTTDNTGNTFSAGSVELVDDDSGSALFQVAGMVPGQTEVECITVSYVGSISEPGAVRLYSGGFTDTGALADELNVTVEEGTGGEFGDCSGFSGSVIASKSLTAFDTDHTGYGDGAGAWQPTGTPESRTYRFIVELDPNADNAVQGEAVSGLTFTWEVQS